MRAGQPGAAAETPARSAFIIRLVCSWKGVGGSYLVSWQTGSETFVEGLLCVSCVYLCSAKPALAQVVGKDEPGAEGRRQEQDGG